MLTHMVRQGCLIGLLCAMGLAQPAWAQGSVLHIGATESLSTNKKSKDKAALETLHSFIKEETGMDNDIVSSLTWQILAEKMAKGDLQIGVFQGIELAWVQQKYPEMKPLAIAVNAHRYPVAYVVVNHDNSAKSLADLKGKRLSYCTVGYSFLQTYLKHEINKSPKEYFSKVEQPDNVEDAIENVLDGKADVAIADQASLEAFRRRLPGRFKQLKSIAHSQPFPAPVVAYYTGKLDEAKAKQFRDGLLGASQKERGQSILTMFRLTGFEAIPSDFDIVLAAALKTYSPTSANELP